jgi:hypothetical protein
MTETNSPSQPEPWAELLAGYVLGDLNPAEIEMVDRYLVEHLEQRSEVENLMLTLDLLPLTLSADCPPVALKQKIMQIAESEIVINNLTLDRSSIYNCWIRLTNIWWTRLAKLSSQSRISNS